MNAWINWLCLWLADYYLSATILLAALLAAGTLLREPVKRISLAWGALPGLIALAFLCAAPFWPRLSLVKPIEQPIAEAPSIQPIRAAVNPTNSSTPLPMPPMPSHVDAMPRAISIDGPPPLDVAVVNHVSHPIDVRNIFAAIFLSGAAAMSLWLAIGAIYSRRLCRKASPAPQFVEELLTTVANEIFLSSGERAGVRGLPRLLVSPSIHTAAACGLVLPTILLPETTVSIEQTVPAERVASDAAKIITPSSAALRALLAHELAHIRRGDLWLLALGRLLLVVLFAHPLFWLLRRRVRADQELIVDALAANCCGRHDYAENLLHWARQQPRALPRLAGALGIWERPSQLSRRIAMLLDERIRPQAFCTRLWRFSIFALTTTTVVALSMITLRPMPVAKADTPPRGQADASKEVFSFDTPDDQVVARIGGTEIFARELKASIRERLAKAAIAPQEQGWLYVVAGPRLLRDLITQRLVFLDAEANVSPEKFVQIKSQIIEAFDKEELPKLLRQNETVDVRELDRKLNKDSKSLEGFRKLFLEQNVYHNWLRQQIKQLEQNSDISESMGEKMDRVIDSYLAKLRVNTQVWTIYDNEPGGLDGPPPEKVKRLQEDAKKDAVVTGGFRQVATRGGVDIVVQRAGGENKNKITNGLPEELGPQIAKLRGVEHVTGGLLDMISFHDEGISVALLNGWPAGCPLFDRLTIQPGGKKLAAGDTGQIMIGRVLAANLDKKLGDTLDLYGSEPFKIVAIYESANVFENGGAVVLLQELQRMMKRPGEVTGFCVTAKKPIDETGINALCKQIELLAGSLHRDGEKPLELRAKPSIEFVKENEGKKSPIDESSEKKEESEKKQPDEKSSESNLNSAEKPQPAEKQAANENTKLLLEVVAKIRANYDHLKTVQGVLESVAVDPSIEKPTTTTSDLPNGGRISVTQVPLSVNRIKFTLKGADVRYESLVRSTDKWDPVNTIVRTGDRWIFWNHKSQSAKIQKTNQIPGIMAIDPREMSGQFDARRGLIDSLAAGRIVEVQSRKPLLQLRVESGVAPHTWQCTYILDPTKNFLPVSILGHDAEGNIASLSEYTYDEVVPNTAWFLQQLTLKFFGEKRVKDVTDEPWTQMQLYRLVGKLRINEEVGDETFDVKFPPNTRIDDMSGEWPWSPL